MQASFISERLKPFYFAISPIFQLQFHFWRTFRSSWPAHPRSWLLFDNTSRSDIPSTITSPPCTYPWLSKRVVIPQVPSFVLPVQHLHCSSTALAWQGILSLYVCSLTSTTCVYSWNCYTATAKADYTAYGSYKALKEHPPPLHVRPPVFPKLVYSFCSCFYL